MALGRSKILLLLGALPLAGALSSAACTAVDEQSSPDGGQCIGPSCGPSDAGYEQTIIDVPQPDTSTDAGPPQANPLCGAALCVPDDPTACGASAPTGDAGSPDDASADVSLADGQSADGGAPEAGASEPVLGCGVTRAPGGSPEADCVPSGDGDEGAPCVSSADCRPGHACVGESANTGQCRSYCCVDPASCGKGTFCAERPLKEGSGVGTALKVPVCVPADNCSLDEPYPCPPNKQCKCKEGTACAVVKDDQTTSCVPPGTGRGGDPCPCAAGYVCSKSSTTCLKLCSTDGATNDCGSGTCQSVAYLPAGFGVCGLGGADGG